MPLINPNHKKIEKAAWRIRLDGNIAQEILEYCEWAGIRYRDTFIEKACAYIFAHDNEWIQYKASQGGHPPTSPDKGAAEADNEA